MSILNHLVAAATVADEVTPDPDQVTPGVIGFIATFFVAAVTVLLVIDMVRRVRRVNYRAQVREQLEAEVAARDSESSAVEGRVDREKEDGGPVAEERHDR